MPATLRKYTLLYALVPASVAAIAVISMFSFSSGHWGAVLRPLGFAVMAAGLLTVVAISAFRDVQRGSIGASLMVALITGGHVLLGTIGLSAAVGAVWQWRRMHNVPYRIPWKALLQIPIITLLVLVAWLPISGAVVLADFDIDHRTAVARSSGLPELPNIYVLLLDSYPRHDVLREVYGFDNRPFLTQLEHRGFDIYEHATSREESTGRSILRMLSGSVEGIPERGAPALRETWRRLSNAPALADLAAAGYERVAIVQQVVHVPIRGWDHTIDTGQLTNLEVGLISRSPFAAFATDWVVQQQRDRVRDSMHALGALADAAKRRVVLAHINSPHAPIVFGSDGVPAHPARCWPRCDLFAVTPGDLQLSDGAFSMAFVAQLRYLNFLTLRTVDELISRDPSAVIVVLSDHGSRYSDVDVREKHLTLLTMRTPGKRLVFADNERPDDLFRRIMRAYGWPVSS